MEGDSESRRIAQSLAVKVVELETENLRLKEEVAGLAESEKALLSKNRLFEAKVLELQARLLYPPASKQPGGGKQGAGPVPKFRSPFVNDERGGLVYRFERPESARRPGGGMHASGAMTARDEAGRGGASERKRLALGGRGGRGGGALSARGQGRAAESPGAVLGGGFGSRPQSSSGEQQQQQQQQQAFAASPQRTTSSSGPQSSVQGEQIARSPSTASRQGDGGVSGGESREGGGGDALEVLRKDLEGGLISSETRLTVEANYCVDTGHKALTVRHNPEKYRDMAQQLQKAVAVTFEGWRVSTVVNEHEWSAPASGDPGVEGPEGQLPLGAFEVGLTWEVAGGERRAELHSKLRSRKFPDTFAMLSSVIRLVGAHAEALLSKRGGEE